MRPELYFSRNPLRLCSANPGLSVSGHLVYNDRQNPPLSSACGTGQSGSFCTPEAAMKPGGTESSQPKKTGRPEDASPQPETRAQRLARIKREIDAGTYETPEKLEAAVERMLGVLID